jgi:ATP-binding cassette subfamily B protein
MSTWRSLAGIRAHLWRYRSAWAVGMSCLVLKDLAQAAQPIMIRDAIDSLGAAGGLFLRYAVFLAGLAIVKGFFQYWMRVILIGISRDVEYDMRNELFQHLITLSPDYYGRTRTGDIMARSTNDLNAVRMMLGPGVMYLCETGLTFALSIPVMART